MSALGRWTSTEPLLDGNPKKLLEDGKGQLLATSPYNYSLNNPANLTDPDGRCPICSPWDALDYGAATLSIRDAWNNPSLSNAGWAVADVAAAVAPGIPSAGLARHGAKLFARTGDVAKAVSTGARRISGISAGKRVENIGNFASGSLLKGHFQKHAGEFAGKFNNAREYARGAQNFFKREGEELLQYQRGHGDIVKYDVKNNIFGVAGDDETIQTFFKPENGIGYIREEIKRDLGADALNQFDEAIGY
jgi:hypothetical protein